MGHRVLVVEDDPMLRKLMELHMRIFGFECQLAEDGAQGLDAITQWRPDIVVTDVMMPGVSGFALCRELRSSDDPGLASTPVIILSARGVDDQVQEVLGLGGISFMNKPFDAQALRQEIDARVTTAPMAAAVPAAVPIVDPTSIHMPMRGITQ